MAAAVLASLGSARNRGADAAVKSNLANARSQGEIFWNTNTIVRDSYTNVCTNGVVGGANGVGSLVLAAARATGLTVYATNAIGSTATAT